MSPRSSSARTMLFALGRRTVASWLRAAGVTDHWKAYYYIWVTLALILRHTLWGPPDSSGVSSHYGLSRATIGSSSAGWSKSRQHSCGTPSKALAKRSLLSDSPVTLRMKIAATCFGWLRAMPP